VIGERTFRGRQITLTTMCKLNSNPHWHASHVTSLGAGSTRSEGMGWCLTSPAAWLWVLTGYSRKAWSK
jgi:hypothetical protein